MPPPAISEVYKNHRFPGEMLSRGVWLSYRCTLSYRDVPAHLCARGITVSHEAIRPSCRQCGQDYAKQLRHQRPRPGDQWHWDEVCLTIHGKQYDLWRAVAQDDNVLDMLVQSRRHTHAAKKFFRTLLKNLPYVPRVVITATCKNDGVAKRESRLGGAHRQSRFLNDRGENSQWPTRPREYRMQGFNSPGHAPRFLSVDGPIAPHWQPRRHWLSAAEYRQEMRNRFESWAEMTGTERAA